MSRAVRQLQQLRVVAEICHVQRAGAEQRHLICAAEAKQTRSTRDDAFAELSDAVGAWSSAAAGDLFDPGMTGLWSMAVQECREAVEGAEGRFEIAVAAEVEAADQARATILRCRIVDELVERAGKVVVRQAEEAALARSTDQHAGRGVRA